MMNTGHRLSADPQVNAAVKAEARRALEAHCLCLRLEGDLVYLPEGYGIDALRIETTAKGYVWAEVKLEEIWQDSLWWKNPEGEEE